mmetsp:Transcript_21069/g.29304  ORF Transcript_21069/g.29304 Transcript_21069/m.29304 type:complete len:129 (+) Transcript_21069:284-670(+)
MSSFNGSNDPKLVYVRIKRKNQTYFVFCNPSSDTSLYLKQQVSAALQHNQDSDAEEKVPPQDMRILLTNGGELDDSKPLGENVKNENELHVVFSKGGVWEQVDITSLEDSLQNPPVVPVPTPQSMMQD